MIHDIRLSMDNEIKRVERHLARIRAAREQLLDGDVGARSLDIEISRTQDYLARFRAARAALEPEHHNGRRRSTLTPRTRKRGSRRQPAVIA